MKTEEILFIISVLSIGYSVICFFELRLSKKKYEIINQIKKNLETMLENRQKIINNQEEMIKILKNR